MVSTSIGVVQSAIASSPLAWHEKPTALTLQSSCDALFGTELLTLGFRTLSNLYCEGGILPKGEMVIIIIHSMFITCSAVARSHYTAREYSAVT